MATPPYSPSCLNTIDAAIVRSTKGCIEQTDPEERIPSSATVSVDAIEQMLPLRSIQRGGWPVSRIRLSRSRAPRSISSQPVASSG